MHDVRRVLRGEEDVERQELGGVMPGTAGPAGYPESYVSIDLETTGVDHTRDAIMEIGAVRFDRGEVVDSFSTFVDPGREIPSDIVYLTGIRDEDVRGAPSIGDVLPDLVAFLGDLPLVAHSAPFDLNFLRAAAGESPEYEFGGGGVYDTLALSRALVPRLPSHRLQALVRFLDVEGGQAHRAGDDALAAGLVFDRLLGLMGETGSAVLGRLASLAPPELAGLFRAAAERTKDRLDPFALPDHGEKEAELLRYDNSRRIDIERRPVGEKVDIDLDAMESLFQVEGPVGEGLSGYEIRREQLQMLRAVGDALTGGVHLLVEAGTGVGKSLAYLVPAIYFAVQNGERVVISTNTRNLQEQLFQKDMPFLAGVLDLPFSSSLLKGRSNYLCAQRWRQVLQKGMTQAERSRLLPVVVWELETESGDISENAAFRGAGYLWNRISAEGGPCLGQRCPLAEKCYLQRARKAAQSAHIVVVNHSLLFSDTETDNKVLGEYSYLICDEAHNIEGVATEHLGRRASVWRTRAALDNLYRKDGGESGDLAEFLAALDAAEETGTLSAAREAGERLKRHVAEAQAAADLFFRALAARHEELNEGHPVEFGKLRYHPGFSVYSILNAELDALVESLNEVSAASEALADLVADADIRRAESTYQALVF
ncbi:MAG: DEAD/DEAH box helicase, partial [Candidatus Eisenbacteria bacterium]|nr:DEAD/DEAH box helicase [Candidatus Eisenbacteria bacterium]